MKLKNKDISKTENEMPQEDFSDVTLQSSTTNCGQTQNITIENGGITLSIDDKHYYISRFHQALIKSFLDNYVPRKYKWLVRSILITFVLALTVGIIYIIIFNMNCSDCKEEL